MIYALVNTLSQNEQNLGHLVSMHTSLLSARQADQRLQLQIKSLGGRHSRLPTKIVGLAKRPLSTAVLHTEVVDPDPA